ncbi:FAD-binding oxidoreductase [Streptomyces sp. NBC_00582]|uniref:FAD-binding oxidoreductase n=1 Tax=Streptomyces sp. NBC_00582 TaxID=2975783 RepID=UPI002E81E17D|nr:FAD-binding oxidoreductase [Streptomyces sp. NBC_00582]WUB66034.1 FAD-binding oxidoreductase [Streptomyces sp. NBC_00582]
MDQTDSTPVAGTPTTAGDLETALTRWREALGPEHVLTDEASLAEFTDPYSPAGFGYRTPAVLQPGSVEDVQAVVRIAAETGVAIWTNSQGRNNGYGGSAPRDPDTVVVNLRRMNRVLEIDEDLAYVVVEPGVSFRDLYDAVQASGKKLWVNMPDISWGSVIGNTLDHGNGFTLYGDHAAAQCGMEVVLADGSLVRTGTGAMTASKTWHLSKRGFGPSTDSLFMQSNMGIVTKMGVWVMPQPDTYKVCDIKVRQESDLEALVDTFRPFLVDGTVANCPMLSILPPPFRRGDFWDQDTPVPRDLPEGLGPEAAVMGAWNIRFALYGDREIVERNFERIHTAIVSIPDAELTGTFIDPEEARLGNPALADQKARVMAGVPDMSMLDVLKMYGTGGHLSFASTIPLAGVDTRRIVDLVRTRVEEAGFDYTCGIILYQRYAIHVSLILYDVADEPQVKAAHQLYRDMVVEAARLGYGEYRTHIAFMDLVAEQFDFNDHAHLAMVERIKDALDPAGILAPGKQGIWPRRLRTTH